jgi:hypothetical protein
MPLQRMTWTGLVRNGLDYLVTDGYMDASDESIKQAYAALEKTDTDNLLNAHTLLDLSQCG